MESASYTHYIKGVSRQTSQHILNILFDAIKSPESPESPARLAWTTGTFSVWDNRVLQHRVVKDHDGTVEVCSLIRDRPTERPFDQIRV